MPASQYSIISQPRPKKSQHKSAFEQDLLDLFARKKAGNLSDYMYSSPNFVGDYVNGAALLQKVYDCCPAYYLQQMEASLVTDIAANVAKSIGPKASFIDYGPGPLISVVNKTLPVIRNLIAPARYVPVDVCADYLLDSADYFRSSLPALDVYSIHGSYYDQRLRYDHYDNPVVYFSGSSMFNVSGQSVAQIEENLLYRAHILKKQLGSKGRLLITHDSERDERRLMEAYDNVFAAKFVTNVLYRARRDLNNVQIVPNLFTYKPVWSESLSTMLNVVSAIAAQEIVIGEQSFLIARGEDFVLANSIKLQPDSFQRIMARAGFKTMQTWQVSNNPMVMHLLQAV